MKIGRKWQLDLNLIFNFVTSKMSAVNRKFLNSITKSTAFENNNDIKIIKNINYYGIILFIHNVLDELLPQRPRGQVSLCFIPYPDA
jgi:hypothetical protein